MSMIKDQAVRDARTAASPILSQQNPTLQRQRMARMQALLTGNITQEQLAMRDRLVTSMKEISDRVEMDDPDSDDSEDEVTRKAKPETKRARQAGLTLFSAQGKELATFTKSMKKCWNTRS